MQHQDRVLRVLIMSLSLAFVFMSSCNEETTAPQPEIMHLRTDETRISDIMNEAGREFSVLRIKNPSNVGLPPLNENYLYLPLFSINVALQPGDILEVSAECEVTNDNSYAVQMGSVIAISDQESDMRDAVVNGTYITGLTGMNVTNEIHHLLMTRAGSLTVPSGISGNNWIHFIGFAISDGRHPGDCLIFERGHLSLVLFRP